MQCRCCKREIPDNALFCCWCGEKQQKERRRKADIRIPSARQLKSGAWNIELRAEGQSITEPTKALCEAKARAVRAGLLTVQKTTPKLTVSAAAAQYIKERENVLSPSTIRGYEVIASTRFTEYRSALLADVNWQKAINDESLKCSPKTIKNSWGFYASVIRANGLPVPNIVLPQLIKKDEPWLDYEQITVFLDAIRGDKCEVGALLALHGLRRSELLAITPLKIDLDRKVILVEGAVVRGSVGMVEKETNKNASSRREVPIMIPRLLELIPDGTKPLVTCHANVLAQWINDVCDAANLPHVACHGLRRSFASLCWHLGIDMMTTMRLGGWADDKICRQVYTKLASKDMDANVKKLRTFYGFTNEFTNDEKKC